MKNLYKVLIMFCIPGLVGQLLNCDWLYYASTYTMNALVLILDKLDEISNR